MIVELITLITCNEMDEDEVREIAQDVDNAPADPTLSWTSDPAVARAVSLVFELGDYVALSDKLDELHEQIAEFFEDPLPPLPEPIHDTEQYFPWVQQELAQRGQPEGGYTLLLLDPYVDDNICAAVVRRGDAERIIELGTLLHGQLDIGIRRA